MMNRLVLRALLLFDEQLKVQSSPRNTFLVGAFVDAEKSDLVIGLSHIRRWTRRSARRVASNKATNTLEA